MSDNKELKFETNYKNDRMNSDDNDKNDSASHDDDRHSNQIDKPNQNPTQHNVGYTKTEKSRPSDTYPHTCSIISQNMNGLGILNDDKLEKASHSLLISKSMRIACRKHGNWENTWESSEYTRCFITGLRRNHSGKDKQVLESWSSCAQN